MKNKTKKKKPFELVARSTFPLVVGPQIYLWGPLEQYFSKGTLSSATAMALDTPERFHNPHIVCGDFVRLALVGVRRGLGFTNFQIALHTHHA